MVGYNMLSAGVIIWILYCVFDIVNAAASKTGTSVVIMSILWAASTTALLASGQANPFLGLVLAVVVISMVSGGLLLITSPPEPVLPRRMGARFIGMGAHIIFASVAWALA